MCKSTQHVENVVGVHTGEYQMPRERRLNGNLSGFAVANLADQYLVRVVAQDRPQTTSKGEAFFLVYGNLQYSGKLIFHRIFDRNYFVAAGENLGHGRVERCRLATAS